MAAPPRRGVLLPPKAHLVPFNVLRPGIKLSHYQINPHSVTSTRLPNYLRTARKHSGLSARDLAQLLGHRTSASVSRYEGFARRPTLATAILLELTLGVPLPSLFPRLYEESQAKVAARALVLLKRLEAQSRARSQATRLRHVRALTGGRCVS